MADPLGISISILEITRKLHSYALAVKDSGEDIRKLSQELFALKGALDYFNSTPKSETETKVSNSDEFEVMVKLTKDTLEIIAKKLRPGEGLFGKATQALTWPLHKADVLNYVKALERSKTFFIMIIMQDNTSRINDVFLELRELSKVFHEDIISRQVQQMHKETDDISKWLSPVDPDQDHAKASRARLVGTGRWFNDEYFESWAGVKPTKKPVLWVLGKTGSGKTTLFSSIVDELMVRHSSRPNQLGCGFFYCSLDQTASQLPANIFGAILAQLGRQKPEILERVRPLMKPEGHIIRQNTLSINEIESLLSFAVGQYELCHILIDALNETPRQHEIVRVLLKLCESCTNVRVLVTCPTVPYAENEAILVRKMVVNAVDQDIDAYVASRLDQDPEFGQLSSQVRVEIRHTIMSAANGTFRWAQLCMDRLSHLRTGRSIRNALKDMPSTLNETYASMLVRISHTEDRAIARECLMWLCFSIQPLNLTQLGEAVVFEESDRALNNDDRLTNPGILLDICSGLMHLDDRKVTLAHDSIRSFLTSEWIQTSESASTIADFTLREEEGHRIIMRKCLAYLQFDAFAGGPVRTLQELRQRLRQYPLAEYAALYWPVHAERTQLRPEDEDFILEFFDSKRQKNGGSFESWVQILLFSVKLGPIRSTEPLYYAASYNMIPILKLLLKPGSGVDIDHPGGRFGSTPLVIALYRGHTEAAKLLLQAGADPEVRDQGTGDRALHWAKLRRMGEIVKMIEDIVAARRVKVGGETGTEQTEMVGASGSVAAG